MAKFVGTEDSDDYTLIEGKRNVVKMLGGDDLVTLGAASFGSDDRVDAGAGTDVAVLNGGGFYNFGHDHFADFEHFLLYEDGQYEIYIDDSVVATDGTLLVSSYELHSKSGIFFDGAQERDGSLDFQASVGDDVLIGGGRADYFYGSKGKDLMTGNEGSDTFAFASEPVHGDAWGRDRITDFHPGEDHLVLYTESVTSFDDLLLDRTREGTVVRTPGSKSSITLLGVLPGDLHASDVLINPSQLPFAHHALAFAYDHGVLA